MSTKLTIVPNIPKNEIKSKYLKKFLLLRLYPEMKKMNWMIVGKIQSDEISIC